MSNWDWNKFTEATKNRQPVSFLVEAVKILGIAKGRVLDLGCGAGIDAKYLAENGFSVEAIDLDEDAVKQTKTICGNLSVNVIQQNIGDFNIAPNSYSLIISWNTLPFLTKEKAEKVLLNIQEGLIEGGIFVFGLLGPKDEWAKNHSEMSFWTVEELKSLLSEMNFIRILEEKQKRPGATGQVKFWHLIQGIAQRKV